MKEVVSPSSFYIILLLSQGIFGQMIISSLCRLIVPLLEQLHFLMRQCMRILASQHFAGNDKHFSLNLAIGMYSTTNSKLVYKNSNYTEVYEIGQFLQYILVQTMLLAIRCVIDSESFSSVYI